jgi:phosphopantothenoylcysteine decarboxylase/phosphopantothenate--cysteine ligase
MNLLLGVSGSIAAYKAVDILRRFQKDGHETAVVMTAAATRFVAPLTFAAFAPGRVYSEMFAPGQDPLLHIRLARECDLLLVAPASADIIGKMANGIADDLLSTVFCAFHKRAVVAPAMNTHMLENPAVADNIARLRGRGVEVIEAAEGPLANLETGRGRLPDVETIVAHCLGGAHV